MTQRRGEERRRGRGPAKLPAVSRIPAPIARARIKDALERAERASLRPVPPAAGPLRHVRAPFVRSLPGWVGRFGLLAGPAGYGLWCEPRPGRGGTFPGQMILDIPRGRYLIDILDAASSTWVSRESAAGGPLVAGLPFTGGPLLAWIRPSP
jgi:hypothetical protein